MVIAGQGTCGLELAKQCKGLHISKADVIVCCGGGGLTAGIALALEQEAPEFTVRTAEPEQFNDVAKSLEAGKICRNHSMSGSICDAILTPEPGEITFPIMKKLCGKGFTVSDEECMRALVKEIPLICFFCTPAFIIHYNSSRINSLVYSCG